MPASFSPAPNSMASLSIDEVAAKAGVSGSGSSLGAHSLETATTTVPCITSTDTEGQGLGAQAGHTMQDQGSAVQAMQEDKDSGEKEGKKKKNRCLTCKKKVGLTGFTCRCGGLFCSIHRYSDKHECGFDYKALGAEEISKSTPAVVASSAPYTDTVTNTSVALTTRPSVQRKSVKATQWWWPRRLPKSNWIVPRF